MITVLLGAPGAGKGTQADGISRHLGLPHLSTGEILRAAVEEGTGLGKRAAQYIDRGFLVPDDVMLGLVEELVEQEAYRAGFILDGFPRTVPQAEGLDATLERHCLTIRAVIFLEIDEETAVARLAARLSCSGCGRIYNRLTMPPGADGVCQSCGGELEPRGDDERETIERRFEQFRTLTEPAIEYYRESGRLHVVDARRTVNEVWEDIRALLEAARRPETDGSRADDQHQKS